MPLSAAPRALSRLARMAALLILALAAPALSGGPPCERPQEGAGEAAQAGSQVERELFEVVRVVDGDTLHIRREGRVEKLRLLSVDTEEKITGRAATSTTKPETVYGQEIALWAREFFDGLAAEGRPAEVGLAFPDGEERYDVYGRLLCHVILPDGRDFNLLLVETGRSPYFNKYGNSRICHQAFVAGQRAAREAKLGVWNPDTNRPRTPGAPAARRPYDRLLPWWQARSEAVDAFRRAREADPLRVADAELPAQLGAASRAVEEGGGPARVFGSIQRLFEETDGRLTVLFRTSDKSRAFRARIPADAREAFADLDLEATREEFHQNYLWVRGELRWSGRGFEMTCTDPEVFEPAGPEPALPEPAEAEQG